MEVNDKKEYREFEKKLIFELSSLFPNLKYRKKRDVEVSSIVYLEISGPNPAMRNYFWLEKYYYLYKYGESDDKTTKDVALDIAEEYLGPQKERSYRFLADVLNAFARDNQLFESRYDAFSPDIVRETYEAGEISIKDLHLEFLSPGPLYDFCANNKEWADKVFLACNKIMRMQKAFCLAIDTVQGIPCEQPKIKPVESEEQREKWRWTLFEELERLQASIEERCEVFSYVHTETMACNTLWNAEKSYEEFLAKIDEKSDDLEALNLSAYGILLLKEASEKVLRDYEDSATEME